MTIYILRNGLISIKSHAIMVKTLVIQNLIKFLAIS